MATNKKLTTPIGEFVAQTEQVLGKGCLHPEFCTGKRECFRRISGWRRRRAPIHELLRIGYCIDRHKYPGRDAGNRRACWLWEQLR